LTGRSAPSVFTSARLEKCLLEAVCQEGGLGFFATDRDVAREDRKADYWPDRWLFQLTGMLADS
jgi:hypothetical protein